MGKLTNKEIIEDHIDTLMYSDLAFLTNYREKFYKLIQDYAKFNAEECLKDFKATGTCLTDSDLRFKKWLEKA